MSQATLFSRFAKWTSRQTGRPHTFTVAITVIVAWVLSGPLFDFSDTWQLVINTATTIVTFLMVFVIQNTQNRDTEAIQIKLDELIRSTQGAHNALLDLEELDEDVLDKFREQYENLALKSRRAIESGGVDIGTPKPRTFRRDIYENALAIPGCKRNLCIQWLCATPECRRWCFEACFIR